VWQRGARALTGVITPYYGTFDGLSLISRRAVKIRVCFEPNSGPDNFLLVQMRSAPSVGDLLDSPEYGPCEVVNVVSTPRDRIQDAVVLVQPQIGGDRSG